jgi:hypothetical protein
MSPRPRSRPYSLIEPGQDCFIVRDASGQTLAYVYFEEEPDKMVACRCRSC